jgi:hypothetical protein
MCRPQERERDRGACQTLSGDAGRSLSGMEGGAPTTSADVATRVSQARRSTSRSTLASRRLWRSRQARAMSPSWTCSSPMRSQSPCPLIVRQVSFQPHPRAACFLPVAPLALTCGRASGSVCLLPPRPCPRRQPSAAWFLLPQHLRRPRSTGKTPCVAGGEKQRRLPLREGYAWQHRSVTQPQAPQRPRALGGR